jgi:hypothetical protein
MMDKTCESFLNFPKLNLMLFILEDSLGFLRNGNGASILKIGLWPLIKFG